MYLTRTIANSVQQNVLYIRGKQLYIMTYVMHKIHVAGTKQVFEIPGVQVYDINKTRGPKETAVLEQAVMEALPHIWVSVEYSCTNIQGPTFKVK